MIKNIASRMFLLDLFFLGFLVTLSLFLISFYFHADVISTGYPDWMVHAFRVQSIKNFGLLSWTHEWANGISLWRTYQFIPHFLTALLVDVINVPVTKGMVYMTVILFVLLRFFIYFILRLLYFSPVTAFVSAVLSFDIAQYWGGVSDYSLMFGFIFFPLSIFLWVKYLHGKLQFLYPYIVGIFFYIHPVLGYSSFGLWMLGILFSDRKIISSSNALQVIVFLLSSSLFWVPLLIKTSYSYSSPNYANKYFLNLVLSGYKYFGLSIFLLVCIAIASVRMFLPIDRKFQWVKIFYIFVVAYLLLIVLGLEVDLPKSISQLQFTRGATIVGIGIVFCFAAVWEDVLALRSRAFKGISLFLLVIVFMEGMWFTSIYSPSASKHFPEAVSTYIKAFPKQNIQNSKVWSSEIGLTSFYAPETIQLPYSYMGQLDPNQISPRISPLILYQLYLDKVPMANITRLNDYFKIAGTKYLFFDENSPFTKTILTSDMQIYKDLGNFKNGNSSYHAFEVPWNIRNAVAIDSKYTGRLGTFPFTLSLSSVTDQIALDGYVKNFNTVLYQPENIPLTVTYPSQDSMEVYVPSGISSNSIYVNESYDSGWLGFFNKKKVVIKPTGPNFMQIILPRGPTKGFIYLHHVWPISFYVSIFVILLIPCELSVLYVLKKILLKN